MPLGGRAPGADLSDEGRPTATGASSGLSAELLVERLAGEEGERGVVLGRVVETAADVAEVAF